jgi:hypothetical protein
MQCKKHSQKQAGWNLSLRCHCPLHLNTGVIFQQSICFTIQTSWVVSIPASYSVGPGFRISAWSLAIMSFLSPTRHRRILEYSTKIGLDRFPPRPFQVIIDSVLSFVSLWSRVLIKKQRGWSRHFPLLWKPNVHYRVKKSPPLGPLCCTWYIYIIHQMI